MNSGEILVSLDIGTETVKVVIGEVLSDSLNIIGVGTTLSNGMRKGAIIDIDQTVQAIQRAVEQAERMVGMEIHSVVVGINGSHVQLQPCHGVVAVQSENREITDEDVIRVIEGAQVVSIPPEREIVDVIPRQFIVDGYDEITDPRGMIGVRLEMEGTLITCSKTMLHNILKCVEQAGLTVADICLQPLAAGTIALSNDEKNLGIALVDIGAGSTTVSVYEDGQLTSTSVIPLGGDNITKDISIGLRTSIEEAENIKQNYGYAYYPDAQEEETFQAAVIGSESKKTFNQVELSAIIEARLEEIYMFIRRETQRMGHYDLPGGYVLTGGSMKLPGSLELAQEVLHQNVRIAIPDYIGVREPQYTSSVGILKFAYHNARIQGKDYPTSVTILSQTDQPTQRIRKTTQKEQPKAKKKESRFASFYKFFFEE